MSRHIKVYDKTKAGYLAFDLLDVLQLIEAQCSELVWAILELELLGDDSGLLNVVELENKVHESSTGLILTWNELVDVASKFKQTIDGTFVGCQSSETIPILDRWNPRPDLCEVIIRAVDTSYWSIYTRDERLLDRIKRHFKDWRPVDQAEP